MTDLRIEQNSITENVSAMLLRKLYEIAVSATGDVYLAGNLQTSRAYERDVQYLTSTFSDLFINVTNGYYIDFEDPVVAQFCIKYYGNGEGVTTSLAAGIGYTSGLQSRTNFFGYQYYHVMDNNTKNSITSLNDFLYFTNNAITSSGTPIYGFPNATSIKFPPSVFTYTSGYSRPCVSECSLLSTIDYNGATFIVSNNGTLYPVHRNRVITNFDSSLIPNQTDFSGIELFYDWSALLNIIFPEGVTATADTFVGMTSLKYVEFPSTVLSIGTQVGIGRDGSNSYVLVFKCTTPPAGYYKPNNNAYNQAGWGWHKFPVAIYVPDNAVNAYKNVTPLSIGSNYHDLQLIWCCQDIIDRIRPLSEMPQYLLLYGTITQEFIDQHMV